MRTTRPHANSPFLSKLPALLAALPLLMLAACGGGEVFLQDGVNPGAGQNHNGGGTQNNIGGGVTQDNSGDGPRRQSDPPDPRNPRCDKPHCAQANDRVDPGDSRCKPGFTGPNCDVPRLNTDYLNNDPTQKLRDACKPAEREKASVKGRLWIMPDNSGYNFTPYSHNLYDEGHYDPKSSDILGLGGKDVLLHLLTETFDVKTCTDGWYAFTLEESKGIANATEGFVEIPAPGAIDPISNKPYATANSLCQTHNCITSSWFKKANNDVREKVKLLVFGGTVSSTPENKKDDLYPNKFATLASGLTNIEVTNIAKEGSTTKEWLTVVSDKDKDKDKGYLEELRKNVLHKNIIVFTLGFTDYYINADIRPRLSPQDTINLIKDAANEAIVNLKSIIKEIRDVNNSAAIVMVNYFNYPDFNEIVQRKILLPSNRLLIANEVRKAIMEVTKIIADENVQVVDILGASMANPPAEGLAKYIENDKTLTLTDDGHQYYANQLYEALGGWKTNGSLGGTMFIGYKPGTK